MKLKSVSSEDLSLVSHPSLPAVIILRPMVGICGMQVCAKKGTPNIDILRVCNLENPAGVSRGWGTVVRTKNESFFEDEKGNPADLPVQCAEYPERKHLIILC